MRHIDSRFLSVDYPFPVRTVQSIAAISYFRVRKSTPCMSATNSASQEALSPGRSDGPAG